ncbi:MAG: nucleotidyltransferase family protein [Spirochaetota bacterium]
MADAAVVDTELLTRVSRRHGATLVAIFGSRARGGRSPESDLDVLVRFEEPKSLFELVQIEIELADALGVPVDLVTEASLSPYMRDRVSREMHVVYDERA